MAITSESPLPQNPQGDVLSPPSMALAELLWQRRHFLARCVAAGLLLATVLAYLIPKQYKSTVQLMPPDARASSLTGMLSAGAGGGGLSGGAATLMGVKTPNAAFFGILRSRTVQDDIINRFDLQHVYHVKLYEAARNKLASRTEIDEDTVSDDLSITVTDDDPHRARDIAASYVDELNKMVATESTSSARRERMFLEEQLKSIKEQVDFDTRQLGSFSSKNITFDAQTQEPSMLDSAAKLQQELFTAEGELLSARTIYSEDNVHILSLRAQIDSLQKHLNEITGTDAAHGSKLETGQLYPSIRQFPLLGETYADLRRRAELDEGVYELLTKQYELAKVEEARDIPTVKVLDPPNLPEKKSFPPRLLIMLFGSVAALMAGVVWVITGAWYCGESTSSAKNLIEHILRDLNDDFARFKHRAHLGYSKEKSQI